MFRLLSVNISLILFTSILYFPTLLVALLLPEERRARWWRHMAIYIIKVSLFNGGVKLHVTHQQPSEGVENFIYASNHPNHLDGFLLQVVLGSNVAAVTAPLQQFPYIIALWIWRMGAIDILRDDIDKARYTNGHTKREALYKGVATLNRGESVMIFPEGHTEMIEALYYFHTGTARLSLASGVTIQPIVIKDAHTVLSNGFNRKQRTITISFERKIVPEVSYGTDILFTDSEPLRQKVRDLTKRLEDEILRELPLRLVGEQRPHATNVGVFVDIDMTVYDGLSQIDFVIHLVRKKHISLWEGVSIFGLFIREKLGLISHEMMMNMSMKILSGWNKETLEKLIHRFFLHIALPKIQYGLFSILEDHLAKGHRLVFVSEAIHPLAQSFVDFFEADGAVDTSLRRRGKTYTGDIRLLCRGETKAEGVTEYVKEHTIDLAKSYAYGDSITDIPFLLLVANPVAVNPGRKFRRYAFAHSIRVLTDVS